MDGKMYNIILTSLTLVGRSLLDSSEKSSVGRSLLYSLGSSRGESSLAWLLKCFFRASVSIDT